MRSLKETIKTTKPEDVDNVSMGEHTDLSALKAKTGILKRLDVKLAGSKAAGEALKTIQEERIRAEANIAITAIKLSEAAIRSSIVGNALPRIGALTTRLNAASTALDQALTNGCAAEVVTHLKNRSTNVNLMEELQSQGKIGKEEAEVVVSFAQADMLDDIQRSRQRMAEAKKAVDALHGCALQGISEAKDRLK